MYILSYLYQHLLNVLSDEEGQSLAEYGLIIGLIAVLAIAALQLMGTSIQGLLDQVATALSGA